MMQFTRHAYRRFEARRAELALGPPGSNVARQGARESYLLGQLITREEAMERVRGPIRPHFNGYDYIYRTDGTGPGIWIARLSRSGRCEIVLTYLAPACVEQRVLRRRMIQGRLVRLLPPPVVRHKSPHIANMSPHVADMSPQVADTSPHVAGLSAQVAATSLSIADRSPSAAGMSRQRAFTVLALRRRFR